MTYCQFHVSLKRAIQSIGIYVNFSSIAIAISCTCLVCVLVGCWRHRCLPQLTVFHAWGDPWSYTTPDETSMVDVSGIYECDCAITDDWTAYRCRIREQTSCCHRQSWSRPSAARCTGKMRVVRVGSRSCTQTLHTHTHTHTHINARTLLLRTSSIAPNECKRRYLGYSGAMYCPIKMKFDILHGGPAPRMAPPKL